MGCLQSRPVRSETLHTGAGALPVTNSDAPVTDLKELCKPKWTSELPMTPEQLEVQKEGFWETAPTYEGKPEIWDALRRICEAPSLSQAQTIAKSIPLNFPTGKISDGCYDPLGNFYTLPNYCLSDPINLLPFSEPQASLKVENEPLPTKTEDALSQHTLIERLAKPDIKIRIRLNTSEDVLLEVSRSDTIAQVRERLGAARNWEQDGNQPQNVRFIYFGKVLKPTSTLTSLNVSTDAVIQAQIS